MELPFSYNRLSESTLRGLGQGQGHLEDTCAWCPSSGQRDKFAAPFGSHRQLHMVKHMLAWGFTKACITENMEIQPKFRKKTDMCICEEGWLGRRTDGKHEDEGRRKESWHTGKKWIFAMERKDHVLKLSPAFIHQHTGREGKKKQEIPGEAALAHLLSPAFVD